MSWLHPTRVEDAVEALRGLARSRAASGEVPPPDPTRRYAVLGGGAFAALIFAGLGMMRLLSGDGDPVFRLIAGPGMFLLAAGVLYFAWTASRDTSSAADFARIAEARGLRWIRGATLTGPDVGVVPWFMTEEKVSDAQFCVHLHLAGTVDGRNVAYVECDQVVDPMGGNAFLGKTGLVAINRHKRLALRGLDAVVGLDRIGAPDLVVVPRADAAIGHYRDALDGGEVSLPAPLDRMYWAAADGPVDALLAGELGRLLGEMDWCILQVIGGYPVFIGSHRGRNLVAPMARAAGVIEENLEIAGEMFSALGAASAPAPVDVSVAAPREVERLVEPARRSERGGGAGVWVARGVGGLVSAVSAFLALAVMLSMVPDHLAQDSSAWPSVQGTVHSLEIQESGKKFRPQVRYSYEVGGRKYDGRRIQAGLSRVDSRAEVDALTRGLGRGTPVTVYHHPDWPSISVLRRGAHAGASMAGGLFCLVVFAMTGLGGLLLVALGGRR